MRNEATEKYYVRAKRSPTHVIVIRAHTHTHTLTLPCSECARTHTHERQREITRTSIVTQLSNDNATIPGFNRIEFTRAWQQYFPAWPIQRRYCCIAQPTSATTRSSTATQKCVHVFSCRTALGRIPTLILHSAFHVIFFCPFLHRSLSFARLARFAVRIGYSAMAAAQPYTYAMHILGETSIYYVRASLLPLSHTYTRARATKF